MKMPLWSPLRSYKFCHSIVEKSNEFFFFFSTFFFIYCSFELKLIHSQFLIFFHFAKVNSTFMHVWMVIKYKYIKSAKHCCSTTVTSKKKTDFMFDLWETLAIRKHWLLHIDRYVINGDLNLFFTLYSLKSFFLLLFSFSRQTDGREN